MKSIFLQGRHKFYIKWGFSFTATFFVLYYFFLKSNAAATDRHALIVAASVSVLGGLAWSEIMWRFTHRKHSGAAK